MKTFEWCGYNWMLDMKGRIIHPEQPWMWYGEDAIRLNEDGSLGLRIKLNLKDIIYKGAPYNPRYEVAVIRSVEDFGYGTYSCEIKLPEGYGLWPSFWLTGSKDWPPEIDIMEAWSRESDYYVFPLSRRITTNVHYKDDSGKHCHVRSKNMSILKSIKSPIGNFVEYKCVWKPNDIRFYVNDKLVRKIDEDVCYRISGKMNVIFDFWCDNPEYNKVNMFAPMIIRNFKYKPL